MPPDALLTLEGVSVAYDGMRAISDVTLRVPEHAVVALLGANGAGKTTTLRAISGLARPEAGSIRFAGERIDRLPAYRISRRGVLQVPEGRGIFPSLTVRANLEMTGLALGAGGDAIGAAVDHFPALGARLQQLAGSLSGGEQQMLALARALLARPRLLLLDEISMGLAPKIVSTLFAAVRGMAAQGTTVLLVEQYVDAALAMADYAYVLDKGRVVDVGEPADLQAGGLLTSYLGG